MGFNIEAFIWYLLLIDSLGATFTALFCAKWFKKNYKGFWKHFPVTKGWALFYLALVVYIGVLLYRLGVLWW